MAKKTRIELKDEDQNIFLPDNTLKEITPSFHRERNLNQIDSTLNFLSDSEYLRELSNAEILNGVTYQPSLIDNQRTMIATQSSEFIVLLPDTTASGVPDVFFVNSTSASVTRISTSGVVLQDSQGNIIPFYESTNQNQYIKVSKIAVNSWRVDRIYEPIPYSISGIAIGQVLIWDGLTFTNQALPTTTVTPYIDKGTISGAFIWDVDNEPKIKAVFNGDVVLSIIAANGKDGEFDIQQDATGFRNLSIPSGSLVGNSGNGLISLSSTPNAKDKLFVNNNGSDIKFDLVENYN